MNIPVLQIIEWTPQHVILAPSENQSNEQGKEEITQMIQRILREKIIIYLL